MQINASLFESKLTRHRALRMMTSGDVQLLGSDCHDMSVRPPNLDVAVRYLEEQGEATLIPQLVEFNRFILHGAIPLERAISEQTPSV